MRLFHFPNIEKRIERSIKHTLFGGFQSKIRGEIGEDVVSFTTSHCFPSYSKTLQDVYLHFHNGHTTQIDEIVISDSGIFVFEIKNYKGWIFGNQNNRYWTQVLYIGKGDTEKNQLYNPIKQNQTHINCINGIIHDDTIPIHSIVVFTNQSTFKDLTYNPREVSVIHRNELRTTISEINHVYSGSLSQSDIENIYDKLRKNISSSNSEEHIEQIRRTKDNQTDLRCPLCGSKLVVRTSRRGNNIGSQFYGCSSYPRCKYTRNIE